MAVALPRLKQTKWLVTARAYRNYKSDKDVGMAFTDTFVINEQPAFWYLSGRWRGNFPAVEQFDGCTILMVHEFTENVTRYDTCTTQNSSKS